jgi:hypothetical protein
MSLIFNNKQLRYPLSGSFTGSFSGSFAGDGSQLTNLPIPEIDTGSLVTTSSFNSLTSSFNSYTSSADIRLSGLEVESGSLRTTFSSFTGSYNTGSFTGSFIGDGSQLTGIVSSKWSGSNPITRDSNVEITGSLKVSGSIDVTNIVNAFILSGSLRTDKISFTEQGTFTGVQGDLGYSFSDGKFTFYIENDVPIELGQTLYARVRNADSVVLTKGTIVDFTATTTGQTPRVKRAIATSGSDCSCFVGIVLQNIGVNQFGAIMLNGVARGLNLTSFNTDDQLYLSSTISGSATTAIPTPPVKAIRIGKVLNASNSPTQGVLYVRPENRTVYFDLDQFKQTYNTGSFTGSFVGDGSQLTGIVSSKWTGSNTITREGDVEITGSLTVTNGVTSSLYGTSSFATTASYAVNSLSASFALSSSYVAVSTNSGNLTKLGTDNLIYTGRVASTSNTVDFAELKVFGTVASPLTGSVLTDYTGAIDGLVQIGYHNDATMPYPVSWTLDDGDEGYTANQTNFFAVWYLGNNKAKLIRKGVV